LYEQDSDRLDRCSRLVKVVFSRSSHFPFIAVLLATGQPFKKLERLLPKLAEPQHKSKCVSKHDVLKFFYLASTIFLLPHTELP
jgi:hypothetical protein